MIPSYTCLTNGGRGMHRLQMLGHQAGPGTACPDLLHSERPAR